MSLGPSELEDFIRRIPKTETHLHVEGALPYELLTELDGKRFPAVPAFRTPDYRYTGFVEFEDLLIEHALAWFDSAERYHLACKRMFEKMASLNIKYVETSFHLHMIEFIGVDGPEVISAIKSAAPEGMDVRVFGGMARNGCSDVMRPIFETLHQWEGLDGIDLHGQEWHDLEDWAPPLWKRCRDAGKIVKCHAGEFGGPEKIYEALDTLGSRRIQHGVRAIEDASLVKRLADEGVVLDVCPLSNVKLGVFPDFESHPLRELVDAGITCTISTDDPLCFANDILDEYRTVAQRLGFSKQELGQLARNGFEHSQLDASLKRQYLSQIDEALLK